MSALLPPFLASVVASFAVLLLLLRPQAVSKVTSRRLAGIHKSIRSSVISIDGRELEKDDPWGYLESLEVILERLRPGKAIKTVLLHANSNLSLSGFFMASAGSALAASLIGDIFSRMLWVSILCGVPGAIIPTIVLRIKRNRRVKAFNAALPDAIDLMARCLVAGHSVGSSIEM
ncbi:MAG TPA: hypothetical protein VJU82_16200, partial [Acidobacteriaceae bacterium]|nr:hypothetical protein [Acidobacteriaceae bacterium]